jgi:hypothetical protein
LVELLVVSVAAVLAGADTFGRIFGLIEPGQFEAASWRWMQGVLPALDAQVVAIDGKASRVRPTGVPCQSPAVVWPAIICGHRANG